MNYYNDNDPKAAAWLRELIKQNLIPPGDVDERSIADVTGADLKGYTQVHMFAGIGGWSEALRLAGWPTTRPVWTGSCPCQPFSSAGKRQGTRDKRHLWPEFYRLIRECRPVTVFGEQVERAIGLGWLDGVFADLEAENYTCGAAVLGAHSVNAPHIRQRLYWVADSDGKQTFSTNQGGFYTEFGGGGNISRMADTKHDGHDRQGRNETEQGGNGENNRLFIGGDNKLCGPSGVADSESSKFEEYISEDKYNRPGLANGGTNGGMEYSTSDGRNTRRAESERRSTTCGCSESNFWSNSIWIPCNDGKARRIEPGICPLADGISGRVAMLRGFGNAIVPQVAAEFIKAYEECDK